MESAKDYFFLKNTELKGRGETGSTLPLNEPIRCSFLIHPLTAGQLWKHPLLRFVKFLPKVAQQNLEKWISSFPVQRYSQLLGVKSARNGQEVVCDMMLMLATPRQLLQMAPSHLNQKLLECAEKSKQLGSHLLGLGAYTKVPGDGGAMVSDQSPIPITTGNSLSAASTLWSAEAALKKLRPDLKRSSDGKLPIRVMVIGATGSIGRVTSLILSEEVKELILISRGMDKLKELQEEIFSHSAECQVKIATEVGEWIGSVDLLITATSSHDQKLFEVRALKSGAVVCDCSRPMDFTREDALARPDVLFIESGEVALPGNPYFSKQVLIDKNHIYACLAETLILAMEKRFEAFSYSKRLDVKKVREISELAFLHGARLAPLRGPLGLIGEEQFSSIRNSMKTR